MDERPAGLIAVLGAPPVVGELIASYLRVQLQSFSVERFAACTDLRAEVPVRAFALIGAPVAREVAWIRVNFPWSPVVIAPGCTGSNLATETYRWAAQGFVPRSTPLSALAEALRTVLTGRLRISRLVPVGNGSAAAHGRRPSMASSMSWRRASQALANAPPRRESETGRPPYLHPPCLRNELAVMTNEMARAEETAYRGPCRRCRPAEDWRGPERRRIVRP